MCLWVGNLSSSEEQSKHLGCGKGLRAPPSLPRHQCTRPTGSLVGNMVPDPTVGLWTPPSAEMLWGSSLSKCPRPVSQVVRSHPGRSQKPVASPDTHFTWMGLRAGRLGRCEGHSPSSDSAAAHCSSRPRKTPSGLCFEEKSLKAEFQGSCQADNFARKNITPMC